MPPISRATAFMVVFAVACNSTSGSPPSQGTDAGLEDVEAGVVPGVCPSAVATTIGETCTGFGEGAACDPSCGLLYGYICAKGGPPGFTGCVQVSSSSLGETYCCPKNDCVAEPDQDARCAADPDGGTTHLFQCPPDGNGGNAFPASTCVASAAPEGSPYVYFCCP